MMPPRRPQGDREPRILTPRSVSAIPSEGVLFPLTEGETQEMVRAALDEDEAFADLTTIAAVLSDRRSRATLAAREAGVIAGIPLAIEAFKQLDGDIVVRVDAEDGARVQPASPVLFLTGHARAILSAERVALNYLQRLSGIASLTRRFVDAVRGTKARIVDTRKTTPGWRRLEKYAVRCGGGLNHRMSLRTGILVKDNHLMAVDGDIALAVRRARAVAPAGMKVEIECDRLEQVEEALAAGAEMILLDNMSTTDMTEAVRLAGGRAILEASGGVTLANVRQIAETGVDWISIGALTHSVPALDLALDFDE